MDKIEEYRWWLEFQYDLAKDGQYTFTEETPIGLPAERAKFHAKGFKGALKEFNRLFPAGGEMGRAFDTICPKCNGLIARPGVVYGYSGEFCYCPDEEQKRIEANKVCLCLRCLYRFTCDYALSMWAAKARFDKTFSLDRVSSITIKCTRFKENEGNSNNPRPN